MQIVRETIYDNPNLILPAPAILLQLNRVDDFANATEDQLARSARIVGEAIPALASELAVVSGGSPSRSIAHLIGDYVARTCLALQKDNLYATERANVFVEAGHLLVVYEFREREFALMAGRLAVEIWDAMLTDAGGQLNVLKELHGAFKQRANAVVATSGTRHLLREAELRNIPSLRFLSPDLPIVRLRGIIQLGHGIKQERFLNGLTGESSAMAYELSSYKPVAAKLFEDHGIPTPRRGIVNTEEQAVTTAHRIGFPVVIKPINQDKGAGVQIGIADEAELRRVYAKTRALGLVQVEQHLPGFDYRFTFVRGALVGVLCTRPPNIVGDGKATVQQLLDIDPVRVPGMGRARVKIDDEVLGNVRARGYALDDVLPAGESILLRRWWRNQNDHVIEDVTGSTHRENIEAALLAVQMVDLDVAGVDYITTDITRPFRETGGAFTEVNPMPALASMQYCGMPAFRMLLEAFFPPGEDGRIPTALVLGTSDDAETIAVTLAMLAKSGHAVGLASRTRVEVAGKIIGRASLDVAARAKLVFRDPRSTAVLLHTTVEAIVRDGAPVEQCDVGVILQPSSMSTTGADMNAATLISTLARKAIILNCGDPRSSALLPIAGSKRVLWIVDTLDEPVDTAFRRPGDAAIMVRRFDATPFVTLVDDEAKHRLAPAPAHMTLGDAAGIDVRRTHLIAVAVMCALGSSPGELSELIPRVL